MDITPILHKEIDLIQNRITRMLNSSFLVKGWTLTITGIVFAISIKEKYAFLVLLGLFAIIVMFWSLDTFFLRTEKKYKAMYEDVVKKRLQEPPDLSDLYSLDKDKYDSNVKPFLKIMFSKTMLPFYGVICAVTLGIAACSWWMNIWW